MTVTTKQQPMYERLAESLAERIAAGEFDAVAAGERPKLPSENSLRTEHGLPDVDREISKSVIRQAIRVLAERGLVETIHGEGTYLNRVHKLVLSMTHTEDLDHRTNHLATDAWSSDVIAAGHVPDQEFELLKVLAKNVVVPELDVVQSLGVGSDAVLTVRRCWRTVDGKPSSVETSWFGPDVVAALPEIGIPEDITRGTTVLLGEHYPNLDHYDEVGTEPPTSAEQSFLKLPAGVVFLVRIRITFDEPGGTPLRLMRTVYRGDQYKIGYGVSGRGNVVYRGGVSR